MSLPIEAKNHALIAPGQGNQTPGMGLEVARAFPTAREVWRAADRTMQPVIGQKLTDLVWKGSSENLQATEVSQPTSIADSLARMKGLQGSGDFTGAEWHTGNSLGFVVALVTSGALALKDAPQFGLGRGEAFKYAVEVSPPTTMLALNGVDQEVIEELRERFNLALCLENPGKQSVLGGLIPNIREAKKYLTDNGIGDDKATSLEGKVDAAFHSFWMEPAVSRYREVVNNLPIREPSGKLVAGSTVSVVKRPDEIREALVLQLTKTERFAGVIKHMVEQGVNIMTELNGTPRLVAMLRREFKGSYTNKVVVRRNGRDITLGFRWHASDALPMMAGGSGSMTREEIFDWYKKWIAERVGEDTAEDLNGDSHFVDDATLDSQDLGALRAALLNTFGKVVPEDEAKKNVTIGNAVDATYKLLNS